MGTKFKIDLIVWKCLSTEYREGDRAEFKIDLIVWKYNSYANKQYVMFGLK